MARRSQQVLTLAERCCRSGKVQPDSIFQTSEKELKTSPHSWTTTVTPAATKYLQDFSVANPGMLFAFSVISI
jgi:hypothetical protein